jgi:acyl dehydratase
MTMGPLGDNDRATAPSHIGRTVVDTPRDLLALVGQDLGTSPWLEVTQRDVDDFGRITRDNQWIHVDPDRAATGPFGKTVAHGFLILALCSYFVEAILEIRSEGMSINYGLDRVRFISPVRVGAQIRGLTMVESASEIEGGVHFATKTLVEIDGQEKPACVAVLVGRSYEQV